MRNSLRFALALVATNLKASFALRTAFWIQVVFMVLNNAMFFTVWWIFFHRFDSVRGWDVTDVAALFGLVAAAFGLAMVFAGGVRDLANGIVVGELDALMTQPKSVLLHAAGSRTYASGWGDIGSGFLLLLYSGYLHVESIPIVAVALLVSTTVFVASGILLACAAFWLGRVDSLTRQLWDFLITFSVYPSPLFGGALKVVLFTIVPAGFIGHLPVALIRDFMPLELAAAVGGALVYSGLALWVFQRGLRRYESGNRVGLRA